MTPLDLGELERKRRHEPQAMRAGLTELARRVEENATAIPESKP